MGTFLISRKWGLSPFPGNEECPHFPVHFAPQVRSMEPAACPLQRISHATTRRSGRMKSWIGRGAAALSIIAPFAIAKAQNAPTTDDEIEQEIIVTAQKRATSLQDVPFSIAAVTAEDITTSGASN